MTLYSELNDQDMTIMKIKNEIARKTNRYEKMENTKEKDVQNMTNNHEENMAKYKAKLERLKDLISQKEDLFKQCVTELMRKNNEMKEEFEEYDNLKDTYLQEYINRIGKEQSKEMYKYPCNQHF